MGFQSVEPGSPEPLVGIDPFSRVLQRTCIQPAVANPTFLLPRDKTRVFEDPEVLHDRRQRDIERLSQFCDRCFSFSQAGQNSTPCRIGKGGKCLIQRVRIILNHMVKYIVPRFFCQVYASNRKTLWASLVFITIGNHQTFPHCFYLQFNTPKIPRRGERD